MGGSSIFLFDGMLHSMEMPLVLTGERIHKMLLSRKCLRYGVFVVGRSTVAESEVIRALVNVQIPLCCVNLC